MTPTRHTDRNWFRCAVCYALSARDNLVMIEAGEPTPDHILESRTTPLATARRYVRAAARRHLIAGVRVDTAPLFAEGLRVSTTSIYMGAGPMILSQEQADRAAAICDQMLGTLARLQADFDALRRAADEFVASHPAGSVNPENSSNV